MKQKIRNLLICTMILSGVYCNKKFDSPPAFSGADIQPNLSVRDLRAMHFAGNFEHITSDLVIEGIVVANDRTDNFYKSIMLQDSTGGITICMDASGLYTDYTVGMRIAVKLNDLWMGDYAGMIQLGSAVDRSDPVYPALAAIPVPLFERFISRKELNNAIAPKHIRLDELNDSLQSCLITIDHVEFSATDTGKTYADAVNKLSGNARLTSCNGGSAYIRTSGFANFASARIPRGNGSVTAVYSVFRTDKQLIIRDTSDVQLTGLRCTAPGSKTFLSEDFESGVSNVPVSISGWKNIAESGGISFTRKTSGNNSFAEINAFATSRPAIVSWLIMPPVNLGNSANEVLSFQTKDGFENGAVLQVMVSSNYDGGNAPSKAKWTVLKAVISKGSVSAIANDWVPSGNISLASFPGTVYIAFRYDGADPVNTYDKRTTTFQIDNIKIEGN